MTMIRDADSCPDEPANSRALLRWVCECVSGYPIRGLAGTQYLVKRTQVPGLDQALKDMYLSLNLRSKSLIKIRRRMSS